MTGPSWAAGPGTYFARHPILYRLSLAGAAGAAVIFAEKTTSRRGWQRLGWAVLSTLQVVQFVGIWWVRRRAAPRVIAQRHQPDG